MNIVKGEPMYSEMFFVPPAYHQEIVQEKEKREVKNNRVKCLVMSHGEPHYSEDFFMPLTAAVPPVPENIEDDDGGNHDDGGDHHDSGDDDNGGGNGDDDETENMGSTEDTGDWDNEFFSAEDGDGEDRR